TSSHGTFQVLAQAVLEQARQGDSSIVFVDTAH
ncbi:MAG: FMN-binding protein, partial [Lachnospiraceae bacterium]|nr:FMN-binding protein [Lachnospiraceae bacterium]